MLALMASSRGSDADALRAGHQDFVLVQQRLELVEEAREIIHDFLRLLDPARRRVAAAAAETHEIAHHPRAADRLEQVEDFFALAERIHQRRAHRAHVLKQKAAERGVVLQAGQFGEDDAQVFGALRHLQPGELLDGQGVSPVVRHRAEIIEPVGVRHRAKISRALADLLVIAVQVAEHGLELHHALAVENDIHAEHAVRRGMLRPHRNFEQIRLRITAGRSFG